MNKLELLQALNNDLQVCKANKKESIKTIIKMLSKVKAEIESPYNMGFIAECCIKALFNNDFVKASPKGVNDLNITLSTKQLNKYFNGVATNEIDIKYLNNYSTAHKPLNPAYLCCITPKGCYMIHSEQVEYNNDNKIILSSVYKNAIHLKELSKRLGL